ncbi:hypothetical protein [Micromonospora sp. WMMD736]|uniref:WXG100 family type VII secretion target n=1 Tax=Micromonospora sp. WMMD736 TaxID=3404112 RepID=UPI003B924FD7
MWPHSVAGEPVQPRCCVDLGVSMTQPTPASGLDGIKWEDGLLQILGMPAVDRNQFLNAPWISLSEIKISINDIPDMDSKQSQKNNEFYFFRRVGETSGGKYKTDYWYLTVRARVDWFVGGQGESLHERFYKEFWNRSRDTIFTPVTPLPLDPQSFHTAAETMYNAETWLEHAIGDLQREANDLAGGQSGISGAAATAYRESVEKVRQELQLLRDALQSNQNWTEMLHKNGQAAQNFWNQAREAWSHWASSPQHQPNVIISQVLDQIKAQVSGPGDNAMFTLNVGDGVGGQYNLAFDFEWARLNEDMHASFRRSLNELDQNMRTIYGALRNSLDETVANMLTPSPAPGGGAGGPGGAPNLGGAGGPGTADIGGATKGPDIGGAGEGPDIGGAGEVPDIGGAGEVPDIGGAGEGLETTGAPEAPNLGDLPPASGFESEIPGLGDGFQPGTGGGAGLPDLGAPGGSTGDGLGLGEPPGLPPASGLGGIGGSTGGVGALPPSGFGTGGGLGSIGSPTGGAGRPSPNDSKPGSGVIGGPAGDFDEGPTTIDTDDLPGGKPLPGMFGGTAGEIGGDSFGGMPGERATAGVGAMQIGPLGPAPLSTLTSGTGSAAVPAAGSPYAMGSPSGPMGPMGPMGGGGMGGGGEEKDRERKTWLAEEEEVWGTEPDVLVGVIGRDDTFDGPGVDSTRPSVPQTPGTPYTPSRGTSRQSRGY